MNSETDPRVNDLDALDIENVKGGIPTGERLVEKVTDHILEQVPPPPDP